MPAKAKKTLPRLTLEQIKEAKDIGDESIDVPEWNGTVLVRGLTKAAWDEFLELDSPADRDFLFCQGIVEPEIKPDDVAALLEKSVAPVNRIEKTILRLSGVGRSAEADEARFLAGDSEQ